MAFRNWHLHSLVLLLFTKENSKLMKLCFFCSVFRKDGHFFIVHCNNGVIGNRALCTRCFFNFNAIIWIQAMTTSRTLRSQLLNKLQFMWSEGRAQKSGRVIIDRMSVKYCAILFLCYGAPFADRYLNFNIKGNS